jgi:predicted amidophosphoribosyltransferase
MALRNALLSLVVPPLCAACREPEPSGKALCAECRRGFVAQPEPRCLRCGAPTASQLPECRECRRRALGFDRAWSPFAYEGVARTAVTALKSREVLALSRFIAAELAARAARKSGLPTSNLLERSGPAPPQVGLERSARLLNARSSVRVREGCVVPAEALLIDDVYTTGATLDACGRALKTAGTLDVAALTFARAIRG